MKKSDLKTGMRVRMRNGEIYLVLKDVDTPAYGHQDIVFVRHGAFMTGNRYGDDLMINRRSTFSKEFDIMEIYEIEEGVTFNANMLNLAERHSIWKRQEYTEEQKEIFKALKVLGFNYVARDDEEYEYTLYAYNEKPEKDCDNNYWSSGTGSNPNIELEGKNKEVFDFVKWEDEEPFEIPKV